MRRRTWVILNIWTDSSQSQASGDKTLLNLALYLMTNLGLSNQDGELQKAKRKKCLLIKKITPPISED